MLPVENERVAENGGWMVLFEGFFYILNPCGLMSIFLVTLPMM